MQKLKYKELTVFIVNLRSYILTLFVFYYTKPYYMLSLLKGIYVRKNA